MKYECIKSLVIDQYDDDCSWTGEQSVIEVGTIWNVEQDFGYNFVADKDALHLTLETSDTKNLQWIEIYPDTIQNHFKQLN